MCVYTHTLGSCLCVVRVLLRGSLQQNITPTYYLIEMTLVVHISLKFFDKSFGSLTYLRIKHSEQINYLFDLQHWWWWGG